jgi:hypothetical protein
LTIVQSENTPLGNRTFLPWNSPISFTTVAASQNHEQAEAGNLPNSSCRLTLCDKIRITVVFEGLVPSLVGGTPWRVNSL